MKDRRSVEAEVIRTLIAAIDNAEAPPMPAVKSLLRHDPGGGSPEAKPLVLSKSQVRRVLLAEVQERERAADELERLEKTDPAQAMRAEALLARRYIE